jgi:ATP-dependent Lhr-like helicase
MAKRQRPPAPIEIEPFRIQAVESELSILKNEVKPSFAFNEALVTRELKPYPRLAPWFQEKKFEPWPFQLSAWSAFLEGKSGLIHVPTGSGKTLAAFGGPLSLVQAEQGLQVLYISPLRAVIRDIERAVKEVAGTIDSKIIVESRTGDTTSRVRAKQTKRLPDVLLTTPESLCLLLTRDDFRERIKNLKSVILDEWHELMSSKRGLQVELALSHLLPRAKDARVWALSGTIANLKEAAQVAVGMDREPVLISQKMERAMNIHTVVPKDPLSLPWTGHLGMRMLPEVLEVLDEEKSALIFTNTRSQAEFWYQAILNAKPEMAGAMALHHSSLDMKSRLYVEDSVKNGTIKWVVCTSSLDLGVDFGPVEHVLQIGSAKGVARTIQRAGRANHRPNEAAELYFIPTQAMEVAEIVALKKAAQAGEVESRTPWRGALDVLEQHLVTCACGEPFLPNDLFQEVLKAASYRDLSRETFDWIVDHLTNGGALHHYSQFKKLKWIEDDVNDFALSSDAPSSSPGPQDKLTIATPLIARFHRLSIGTIVSDTTIGVYFTNRKKIGNVEERYLARMNIGDKFLFAGRTLELLNLRDLKAFVKPARGKTTQTPRWLGGKMPISHAVCYELREVLHRAQLSDHSRMSESERSVLIPLFEVQKSVSELPLNSQFLIEFDRSREGTHAFLFPFEGRLVHEGMAALIAWRLAQLKKGTFGLSINDYGIEILSEDKEYPLQKLFEENWFDLIGEENLLPQLANSIRLGEYARRHFREIARVSGLVFQGYRGNEKTAKQMHVSSSLLFDVLSQHEPNNLLLKQAETEVLERQFETSRMLEALTRIRNLTPLFVQTEKFSPLAFPLVFERMAATVSSETLSDRLERMKKSWVAEDRSSP